MIYFLVSYDFALFPWFKKKWKMMKVDNFLSISHVYGRQDKYSKMKIEWWCKYLLIVPLSNRQ